MDIREIEWTGVDWLLLAQVRDKWRAVVNTVMNIWVAVIFSRRTLLHGVGCLLILSRHKRLVAKRSAVADTKNKLFPN